VFSVPFYLLGQLAGFYDQRLIYALLLVIALALAPRLVDGDRRKLALVAILGLNPIMALDVIFGQNDSFILCWLIFSLVGWKAWQTRQARGQPAQWPLLVAVVCFGLACASKPTAWFMAPFFGLLLIADTHPGASWPPTALWPHTKLLLRRAAPGIVVVALLLLPYVLWDAPAFYDDVWRWSNGQGDTGYQIWGWGASNFVLAFGLVSDRFAQWPFWTIEALVGVPLLVWFVYRQLRANTLANACWHYGLLLFGFFYASRFLNENYLGYILAFLAIGALSTHDSTRP
jgi:hypothetical protein